MKQQRLCQSIGCVILVGCAVFNSWTAAGEDQTAPSGTVQFTEQLISNDYLYPYGLAVGDLDGDGDLDLSSSNAQALESRKNVLYWLENDGHGTFRRHLIRREPPGRLERHQLADLNGDNRLDVIIVDNQHGDIRWYVNSPTPREGKSWERHLITAGGLPGAYDVVIGDLDGDDDLDVAGSSWSIGNQFAWFENDGTPADGEWKKHLIEDNVQETRTIRAADFDRDGDLDLLGTITADGLVVWYENRHPTAVHGWKRHLIDTLGRPMHGEPVDLDGDQDWDIIMAAGMGGQEGKQPPAHQIIWYEIFITDDFDENRKPELLQIATIPSGNSSYSYSIQKNLKGTKCRVGIRAVNQYGIRSKISFSAYDFIIDSEGLPSPAVMEPVPGNIYFTYIPFIFDHKGILGRASQRAYYQIHYSFIHIFHNKK